MSLGRPLDALYSKVSLGKSPLGGGVGVVLGSQKSSGESRGERMTSFPLSSLVFEVDSSSNLWGANICFFFSYSIDSDSILI